MIDGVIIFSNPEVLLVRAGVHWAPLVPRDRRALNGRGYEEPPGVVVGIERRGST